MPVPPSLARRLAEEHAYEREQLGRALECGAHEHVTLPCPGCPYGGGGCPRLSLLDQILRAHLCDDEAPGGLLDLAPSPGRVGFAEHAVWSTLREALDALGNGGSVDATATMEAIDEGLQALHAAEDELVLGPLDEEPEPDA